jgi:hypothetical protein
MRTVMSDELKAMSKGHTFLTLIVHRSPLGTDFLGED